MSGGQSLFGQPALVQILDKTNKSDEEKRELFKKIEGVCRANDVSQKGKLTVDDFYTMIKVQCAVECTKTDIRKIVVDLPMDSKYRISIDDFCRVPILSDEVFKVMDKNNDGLVSKGELKLALKHISMPEIEDILKAADGDQDGKLSYDEIKMICAKAAIKHEKRRSKH